MLEYKWEVLDSKRSRIHKIVRDLMGTLIQHTWVTIDWTHPIPDSETYAEKLFTHYE